jgi:hypothetical protein
MKRAASGEDEERSLAEQRRPRGSESGSNRDRAKPAGVSH